MGAEDRLRELGLELPPVPAPVASYVPVTVAGGLAFTAGQIAVDGGAPMWTGKLGAELPVEEGALAARRCALQAVAALREALGSLDRVRGIAKVTVFVASAPGFADHPRVANGASDVLVQIFGEPGRHARSTIGVAELPFGVPVEVELVAAVAD